MALQALPLVQHGWFGPPQPAQPVAVHWSPVPHSEPTMMHCRVVSQHPGEHALPPQHAWPGEPHCRQKPPWHAVPLALQLPPAQQT
jgi:hypothetical protein